MTNRELKIWAWSCLLFGWLFELAGVYRHEPNAYLIALVLLGVALGFFLTDISTPKGGGPLKPA